MPSASRCFFHRVGHILGGQELPFFDVHGLAGSGDRFDHAEKLIGFRVCNSDFNIAFCFLFQRGSFIVIGYRHYHVDEIRREIGRLSNHSERGAACDEHVRETVSGDGIGIRVATNPLHLAPSAWYASPRASATWPRARSSRTCSSVKSPNCARN